MHARSALARTRQAQLIDGLCEREGALWAQQNPPVDPPMAQAWKGPIGQVLGTGLPYVQREGTGLPATYSSMFCLACLPRCRSGICGRLLPLIRVL